MAVLNRIGLGLTPRDWTLLRENPSGQISVMAGGTAFWVNDPSVLDTLFKGMPLQQRRDGALIANGIGSIPRDGTLLREFSSSQVYEMQGGVLTPVTEPQPVGVNVLWNGALALLPRTPTLTSST